MGKMASNAQVSGFPTLLGSDANIKVETGDTTEVNQVLFMSRNTIVYTDTTAKSLFKIPANADIVLIITDVTTAFDAGTNNHIDIGKTGTANHFIDNLDGSSATQSTSGWSNLGDVGTSEIQVTAIYVPSGSAAAHGAATIIFLWTIA